MLLAVEQEPHLCVGNWQIDNDRKDATTDAMSENRGRNHVNLTVSVEGESLACTFVKKRVHAKPPPHDALGKA